MSVRLLTHERDRALKLALAIAKARLERPPTHDDALLFAYLSLLEPQGEWRGRAIRALNAAMRRADELYANARWGLFEGLAGLGWVVEHVARSFDAGEDLNAATDAALVRELERGRWRGSCDVETGLAGIGLYLLERLHVRRASDGAALVVAHLESIVRSLGFAAIFDKDASDAARGLPGVVHFLSEAATAGIEAATCDALVNQSIECLRAMDLSPTLRWSGNLATAAVLFQAARHTESTTLAQEFLGRSSTTPHPDAGRHFSLRRGTTGVAYTLHRLARFEEADPRCAPLAATWLTMTLDALEHDRGVLDDDGTLMDGAPGVALALMSMTTVIEPDWDRRMLLPGVTRQRGSSRCL
jgi:hypothetical protein